MSIAMVSASSGPERSRLRASRAARVSPVEILQHEEVDTVLMTDIEQRADVRMIERRDRPRLALEALAQLRVRGERRGQNFDRDDALETRIAGAIHLAHTAFAERGENLVGSEASAGAKWHGNARLSAQIAPSPYSDSKSAKVINQSLTESDASSWPCEP